MFIKCCALFCLLLIVTNRGQVTVSAEINNGTTDKPNTTTTLSTTVTPPEPTTLPTTVTPPTTATPPPTTATPSTATPPTTAVPTTTAAPDVNPDVWWNVTINGTNCILAAMKIELSVSYNVSENETNVAHFTVLPNSTAAGRCGKADQSLYLLFSNSSGSINFTFSNNDTKNYFLSNVDVNLAVNNVTFPNNTWSDLKNLTFYYKGELFKSNVNVSYTCTAPDSLKLENNQTVPNSLKLSDVKLEAFASQKEKKFNKGLDCVTGETPDIVPIAVGLALALLVIVVLIGFLVSRRRSQARGYLSM